jgi:lipopolysaccharide cholinephosphotransferase
MVYWIDIFPLDNFPDNKIIQISILYYLTFISKIRFIKYFKDNDNRFIIPDRKLYIKAIWLLLIVISAFFPNYKKIDKKIFSIAQKYNKIHTKYLFSYFILFKVKREVKKRFIHEMTDEILFENHYFYCPKNKEEYLISHYGKDYMKIPPIEKRITHNIYISDTDNSYEKYL